MNKFIKIFIVLIIIGIVSGFIYFMSKDVPQVPSIEYNFYKYYSNEKFGVIDKEGNIKIEASFDEVIIPNPTYAVFFLLENQEVFKVVNEKNEEIFFEFEKVLPISVTGLVGEIPYEKQVLIYEENGKQGLINFDGEKLTKAKFNSIESLPYKEGELLCKADDKVYVLTESGKEKIKLDGNIDVYADGYYTNDNADKSGYIVSKQTNDGMLYGYLNCNGKSILDFEYDKIERIQNDDNYLIVVKNGKYGLYKEDKAIINCNYQEINYSESNDLYFVRRGASNGVLDSKGDIIVPVEYKSVERKGVFIEAITKENENIRFDLKGNKTNKFDSFNFISKSNFDNTFIGITDEYEYKLLDNNYNSLIEESYEYIDNILEDRYIIKNSDEKYGVINEQNIKLIENEYDVIQLINTSEVIQTMNIDSDLVTLFDKSGNKIFEENGALVILDNGYIKVFCNDGVKYFTLEGKEISSKEIFSNNNIIGFYENGKWGFKDKSGQVIIEAVYDRIVEVNENGYGGIKLNDFWGVIDKDGNIIVEPKFYIDDSISDPEFLNKFYKNYYASVGSFFVN